MKFLSTVKHNGTRYEAGATVPENKFDKEQLEALKEAGVVETSKAKAKEEDTTGDNDTVEAVDPNKFNHQGLVELAKERGVEVDETATKREIADAINAKASE